MSMKTTYAAVAALAVALAFVPLAQALAAGKHHHHAKGPGTCGENMYWSKGHCVDARDKAS